tara:strand:- start:20 stop:460 length:441 start_codon:yes stop_codon:yes gene_type:complete
MNTHRAVRQYLAKEEKKTELKSERVELTVVGDITKAVKSMNSSEKALETIIVQANKAEDKHEKALLKAYENSLDDQDKLQDKLNKLRSAKAESEKALDAANKAAKGLGLSAKEIPGYTQLQTLIDGYAGLFNAATDDVQKISKVTI